MKAMAAAAGLSAGFSSGVSAATLGAYWDTGTLFDTTAALSVIGSTAPTATFTSTVIDYPSTDGSVVISTTLAAFLGDDANSLSDATAGDKAVGGSVFLFTGFLNLGAGDNTFSVSSDDGFRLTVGGTQVSEYTGSRGFGATTATIDVGDGITPFEFVYFESNFGAAGLEFRLDGALVTGVAGPSAVPLPAAVWLLGSGLVLMGGLGIRRRRSERDATARAAATD